MWPNPQETEDLVAFTEENLNGKLHFCAVMVAVARRENPQRPSKSCSKNTWNRYNEDFNNKVWWDRKIIFNQVSASLKRYFMKSYKEIWL